MIPEGCALYEPDTQLRVIASREHQLRVAGADEAREELDVWARTLELTVIFVIAHEVMLSLGLRTCAEVAQNVETIDRKVRAQAHLDPEKVFEENATVLEPFRRLIIPADAPATGRTEDIVRAVQSLLLFFPEAELTANRRVAPGLAHRCRLCLSALRGFVARHTSPDPESINVAGRAYVEGRLDVDEVAALWVMTVEDAVALLEQRGFRRGVEHLVLDDDVRRQRLAALADERAQRGGAPVVDDAWVDREVIASQRIEDVDARPWLRR